MLVLGLTGPSGAGKGLVGEALSARGFPVLDTDAVYHTLVSVSSPCTQELADCFGAEILTENGSIDRRRLAAIVFCGGEEEKTRKSRLNAIAHRYVLERCDAWLSEQRERGVRAAVIDAPLLIEAGMHRTSDLVLAVLAPYDIRLSRIMLRDGLSEVAARARLDAQPRDDFYRRHASLIFVNDGAADAVADFIRTVEDAVQNYQK